MPRIGKPGKRDLSKEKYWRDTLAKWRASGLSKTEFCKKEGIKINALCNWESIIRARDQEAASRERRRRYIRAAAKRRARRRMESRKAKESSSDRNFVQVRVGSNVSAGLTSNAGMIEILRPDGVVIRIPADLDMHKLLAVLNSISS